MTTQTRTTTQKAAAAKRTTKAATTAMPTATPRTATRTTAATARKATPAKAAPARTPTPADDSPKALVERVRVQADLAGMEARDQWHRLSTEVERRRSAADRAVRDLLEGGTDASRTFANGVRDAVDELRVAVDAAIKALR